MLKKYLSFDNWTKLAVLYLWSAMLLGKSSAYIGLFMGVLLIFGVRVFWDRWFLALTRRADPLNRFAWALLVSLIYGVAQTIYGVAFQGYPVSTALEILVFNIGPIYLFLGIWVGSRHPQAVRKYIQFIAWFTVIYAPIYFLFLSHLNLTLTGILPGSGLELLPNPGSGTVTLMGLLTLEPYLARFWLPIVVLVLMTIANQERSDWLGFGICVMLWGWLSGRLGRVFAIFGCIFAVLVIAALLDVKLPPIPGRGGELSARGTLGRMAGAISPELAAEVSGNRADSRFYYGTVYWREHWWAAIRNEITKENKTMIFGMGYGYPLAKLAGKEVEKEGTRSPHSIFYFTVAYSGIVGFAIFVWLVVTVLLLLWQTHTVIGDTFGLLFFLYALIGAFFGNMIETPQGSIPLYLVLGMVIGPMLVHLDMVRRAARTAPAEVAELV